MMKKSEVELTVEEIVLLHTNDLHSHLENWPRIRRFLEQKKRENEKKIIRQLSRSILGISLIVGILCQKQRMAMPMLN